MMTFECMTSVGAHDETMYVDEERVRRENSESVDAHSVWDADDFLKGPKRKPTKKHFLSFFLPRLESVRVLSFDAWLAP